MASMKVQEKGLYNKAELGGQVDSVSESPGETIANRQ